MPVSFAFEVTWNVGVRVCRDNREVGGTVSVESDPRRGGEFGFPIFDNKLWSYACDDRLKLTWAKGLSLPSLQIVS